MLIESRVLILLLTIWITGGELWFPATVFENSSHEEPSETELKQTYALYSESKYMPLDTVEHRVNNTWHAINSAMNTSLNLNSFKDNSPKYKYVPIKNRSINAFRNTNKTIIFRYNNTINNVNKIKVTRPKQKLFRNKCPPVGRGHKKQSRFNQTARTRFLEVFEVVEFFHETCTSNSGLEGTCLPEHACKASEGSPMGSCADGYGICCVIQFSCDEQTAAPEGWFTNPGFPTPSTERLSCIVTIDKTSEDIQQIRLDFSNFELLPPSSGTCEQDQFVVSGQNMNSVIPILCGVNTGQHVYIEVGDVKGPITLSVQTISAENRLFSVKVTQISAAHKLAAPSGCVQYYKEPQGYIESFNYRDKSDIAIPRYPSYLNNLNYAICIERAPRSCSVTYSNMGYLQIVNYDADGLPVIPPGQAGVEIFNCPTDWLLIAAVRVCGDRFNDGSVLQDFALDAPITDVSAGPIVVWFRSDGGYVGRGFKLQYQQNNC